MMSDSPMDLFLALRHVTKLHSGGPGDWSHPRRLDKAIQVWPNAGPVNLIGILRCFLPLDSGGSAQHLQLHVPACIHQNKDKHGPTISRYVLHAVGTSLSRCNTISNTVSNRTWLALTFAPAQGVSIALYPN